MAATAVKMVNIGGTSLASTMDEGTTIEAVYKGGSIAEILTPAKEVNGEMVSYRLATIPMEATINGKNSPISVRGNGMYAEKKNVIKNGQQYTVIVEKREYEARNGETRTSSQFVMAE